MQTLIRFLQKKARTILHPLFEDQTSLISEMQSQLLRANDSIRANNECMNDVMIAALGDRWDEHPERLISRREVGYWLNRLGLVGKGIEVGVFRGEFSAHLLNTWMGGLLVSIDPWKEFPTSEYNDVCNLDQKGHDQNYDTTVRRLKSFGDRSQVIKNTSHSGALILQMDRSILFTLMPSIIIQL